MTHPDGPLTDDDIDAFMDNPKKRHTLMNGSDTSSMAWRILKRLYFDRTDLRRELAELKRIAPEVQVKWSNRVQEK
jgi:hypothetical protein